MTSVKEGIGASFQTFISGEEVHMQEELGSVGKSSPMFKKQDAPYSIRGEFRGDAQCTEDKRADWEGRQLDQTLEIHGDGNLPPAFMHALVREMLALHRQTNTISKNIKLQQPAMKIAG